MRLKRVKGEIKTAFLHFTLYPFASMAPAFQSTAIAGVKNVLFCQVWAHFSKFAFRSQLTLEFQMKRANFCLTVLITVPTSSEMVSSLNLRETATMSAR